MLLYFTLEDGHYLELAGGGGGLLCNCIHVKWRVELRWCCQLNIPLNWRRETVDSIEHLSLYVHTIYLCCRSCILACLRKCIDKCGCVCV